MLNTQLLSTIPYLNIDKQTCIWLNIIYSVDLNIGGPSTKLLMFR